MSFSGIKERKREAYDILYLITASAVLQSLIFFLVFGFIRLIGFKPNAYNAYMQFFREMGEIFSLEQLQIVKS